MKQPSAGRAFSLERQYARTLGRLSGLSGQYLVQFVLLITIRSIAPDPMFSKCPLIHTGQEEAGYKTWKMNFMQHEMLA